MIDMLLRHFFNKKSESPKSGEKRFSRKLRVESLEERALLSVSPTDFPATPAMYAELNLLPAVPAYQSAEIATVELRYNEFWFSLGGTKMGYLADVSQKEIDTILANPEYFLSAVTPFDAEKTNAGDTQLCWAATSANMLAYAGWGEHAGFENEDAIFDCFREAFDDGAGTAYEANQWFIAGDGNSNGGFFSDYPYVAVAGNENMNTAAGVLRAGNRLATGGAVGLTLGWHTDPDTRPPEAGHLITLWGFTYDTSIPTSDYGHILSLLVSDSDDDSGSGADAPNLLKEISVVWAPDYGHYQLVGYGNDTGYLESYTWLAAYTSVPPVPMPDLEPMPFFANETEAIIVTTNSITGSSDRSKVFDTTVIYTTDDVFIHFAFQNVGSLNVTASNLVRFTLRNNDTSTTYLQDFDYTNILGANKYQIYSNYNVGANFGSLAAGNYTLTLTLDTLNAVDESNEANNVCVKNFTIANVPPPTPYNAYEKNLVDSQGLGDYAFWTEIDGEMRLTEIRAGDAVLSGSLNLSNCTALENLDCSSNQLTSLEVSACTELTTLKCSFNQLTALDLSLCTALTELECDSNYLTFVSLRLPDTDMMSCKYAPQSALAIPDGLPKRFDGLAAQHGAQGETTTYTWYYGMNDAEITEGITNIDGVFTFAKSLAGMPVYCIMTNTCFPEMELRTTFARIAAAVPVTGVITSAPGAATMSAIHEWQRFWAEFWAEGINDGTQIVLAYDADLFVPMTDDGGAIQYQASAGVTLTFGDAVFHAATGLTEVMVTIHFDDTFLWSQMSMRLGAIALTPATTTASGNKPGVPASEIFRDAAVKNWLTINEDNIAANVWAVPYDLNDDGKINIYDLIQFAKTYGGSTEQHPASDFNGDGKINIYDLIQFAKQYGTGVLDANRTIAIPRMATVADTHLEAASDSLPAEIAVMFGISTTPETPIVVTPEVAPQPALTTNQPSGVIRTPLPQPKPAVTRDAYHLVWSDYDPPREAQQPSIALPPVPSAASPNQTAHESIFAEARAEESPATNINAIHRPALEHFQNLFRRKKRLI